MKRNIDCPFVPRWVPDQSRQAARAVMAQRPESSVEFFDGSLPMHPLDTMDRVPLARVPILPGQSGGDGSVPAFVTLGVTDVSRSGEARWYRIVTADGLVLGDGTLGQPNAPVTFTLTAGEILDGRESVFFIPPAELERDEP